MRAYIDIDLKNFDNEAMEKLDSLPFSIDYICFDDGCLQLTGSEMDPCFGSYGIAARLKTWMRIYQIDPETGDDNEREEDEFKTEELVRLFQDAKLTACTVWAPQEAEEILAIAKVIRASVKLLVDDYEFEYEAGPEFVMEINW